MKQNKKRNSNIQIKKESLKLGLLSFLAILIYLILPEFELLPFELLNIDTDNLSTIIKVIYLIAYEVMILSFIVLIFNKRLVKDFKDLKKHHQEYFNKYLKYWFLAIGLMMVSNAIIMAINGGDIANNQKAIENMFNKAPIYILFSSVIFAPICEELVFRLGIRNIFKNDFIFIFISGLFFGSLHVITSYNNYIDLLYIIPYSIPGWVFAYTLTKSDNIYVPMGLHFMHNGILMALQVFVTLFS